jgi:hypothetical protein
MFVKIKLHSSHDLPGAQSTGYTTLRGKSVNPESATINQLDEHKSRNALKWESVSGAANSLLDESGVPFNVGNVFPCSSGVENNVLGGELKFRRQKSGVGVCGVHCETSSLVESIVLSTLEMQVSIFRFLMKATVVNLMC